MLGSTIPDTEVSELTWNLKKVSVIVKSLKIQLAEFPDDQAGRGPRLPSVAPDLYHFKMNTDVQPCAFKALQYVLNI